MSGTHQLGARQLAIMRVLWELGEATVQEVQAGLEAGADLAPTTVATMLRKMEAKGVVTHRSEGRRFVYRATVDEVDVTRSMVRGLVERLFLGDSEALVGHLLREGELDGAQLDALRTRIEDARRGGEA